MAQKQFALIKKKRIGLFLTGNYLWTGGLYYVLNIIKSLNFLEESERPDLVVFINEETPTEVINEISFSFISIRKLKRQKLIFRVVNKIRRMLFKDLSYFERTINSEQLDAIYPFSEFAGNLELNCSVVYWIYDFQHKHLPEMFSKEEIKKRDSDFENIAKHADNIVVSSFDSLNSFRTFFSDSKSEVHVLQFVSLINEEKISNFIFTSKKYKLDHSYFIVANQFWQHKNHLVVLKALATMKNDFVFQIVFTGNQSDHRNESYFTSLMKYIELETLEDKIIFTGFISREDQLSLMKNSIAVIQPSKFEGWSTVIEDAKTLNKLIVASDIPVHREQLKDGKYFFSPDDEQGLSRIMKDLIRSEQGFAHSHVYNYRLKAKEFAHNFVRIFDI